MNYYNEFDPKAAAWLRELIKAGLIPPGEVDERSICDVEGSDLKGFDQCHFFAGIGGWPYALELAGWPADRPVWSGSCPCQSFSAAGKGKGVEDPRDLWPHFHRLIRECRPDRIFGEQVTGAIVHGWLDRVCADLEAEAYAVGHCVLGAHSVGSPHIRQRLYWVADASIPACQRDARGLPQAQEGVRGSRELDGDMPERPEHGGPTRGLAYAECDGGRIDQPGRRPQGRVADRGAGGGVDDAPSPRHEQEGSGQQGESSRRRGMSGMGCGTGGLGNTGSERLEGCEFDARSEQPRPTQAPVAGPWGNYALIPCRDGKARRVGVEPAPMADGVSPGLEHGGGSGPCRPIEVLTKNEAGRAMKLKGYGNAIVPQVAAAFIAACETVTGRDT